MLENKKIKKGSDKYYGLSKEIKARRLGLIKRRNMVDNGHNQRVKVRIVSCCSEKTSEELLREQKLNFGCGFVR